MSKIKSTYAKVKYVKMSSYKVRRVLNRIIGQSYVNALMIIKLMPYRACNIIWQVLYSAASNAYHNFHLDKSNLFISKAYVNQGLKLKRIQPRAKGRAYKILKPTCHITIFLKSIN
jgi:large subunit ribosomal protein L22